MRIGYFEKRREQAREALQKLRGYYNEERFVPWNNDVYLGTRSLVNFKVLNRRTGEEDPIKTLRRIKGSISYRTGDTLSETLRRVEQYEAERQNTNSDEARQNFKAVSADAD